MRATACPMCGDPECLPTVISYSGGSSSEWMVRATIRGVIPRPCRLLVLFADTGSEHSWTYPRVDMVEDACRLAGVLFWRVSQPASMPRAGYMRRSADCLARHHGEPIDDTDERAAHRKTISDALMAYAITGLPSAPAVPADVSRLALHDALLAIPMLPEHSRLDQPPMFIRKMGGSRGRAPSRCTKHYKIGPMDRATKAWCKGNGWALSNGIAKWIGFALDETARAGKAVARQLPYERLEFPAIRCGRTRARQREDLERWVGSSPKFSSCTVCPHNSPARWRDASDDEKKIQVACDEAVRDSSAIGLDEGDAYLSDRLIPVSELHSKGDPQPTLPGLEDYCSGGHCFL